jgi:hypothetical protein
LGAFSFGSQYSHNWRKEMDDKNSAPVSPDAVPELAAPEATPKVGRSKKADKLTGAQRQAAYKLREKEKQEKVAYVYNNQVEPSKKEAYKILQDRGISNQHVIETCYELALVAAEELKIPANAFLFRNGIQQALLSYEMSQRQPLQDIEDVWYPGERIRLPDLQALWDFSTSWREQPDGHKFDFEEFRNLRRLCITDTFEFGRQVLQKDFHPEPHGLWAKELFVQKNPDLLPEVYSQEDVKKALAGQSNLHQRILISSRNSYKSTYNICDLISWVLCFGGDIRILMISATKPLSKGFAKLFRGYFTVKNPRLPMLFNQLWPEHMTVPEDGNSLSYTSPMRILDLIQPTLTSTSLETEGLAGERADIICSEDVAEISNSSTPEQREKTLEKFDLACELLEPTGFLQVIGTPFAPGDIYSVLLDREEERVKAGLAPRLLHKICPCWTVNPGVKKLAYDKTLTPDEVTLLFPSRLTFTGLMAKLRDSLPSGKTFRQQSLCQWVDEMTEEKFSFDVQLIQDHVRSAASFQDARVLKTCLICDPALSISGIADFTAIITMKIMQRGTGRDFAVVCDLDLERLRQHEIATHILTAYKKHGHTHMLVERTGQYEALQRELAMQAVRQGITLPNVYWKPTVSAGISPRSKVMRIKATNIPLSEDRLFFTPGIWNDVVFEQYSRFNMMKSSGSKRDDAIDAISLGIDAYLSRHLTDPTMTDEEKEREEIDRKQTRLKAWSAHVLGSSVSAPQPRSEEPEPESSIFRGLGQHLRRKN